MRVTHDQIGRWGFKRVHDAINVIKLCSRGPVSIDAASATLGLHRKTAEQLISLMHSEALLTRRKHGKGGPGDPPHYVYEIGEAVKS